MVSVCGKQVMFQQDALGYWPVVMDQHTSKRIPLLLEESQIGSMTEVLKRIPEVEYPLDIVAMIVAGGISISMKYKRPWPNG